MKSSEKRKRASIRPRRQSGDARFFCSLRGLALQMVTGNMAADGIGSGRSDNVQNDGHGHDFGSSSARPQSVSSCSPPPSSMHSSAFTRHVATARYIYFRRKLAERAALHTIQTTIEDYPAWYVCILGGREATYSLSNLQIRFPGPGTNNFFIRQHHLSIYTSPRGFQRLLAL